jgi:uncharacterized protein YjbI with pentapeptide repeats
VPRIQVTPPTALLRLLAGRHFGKLIGLTLELMANAQHLEILKKGVAAWNQWRAANRNVRPDLSFANLVRFDLAGANLFLADLAHTNLRDAKLTGATLVSADLTHTNLSGANLSGGNLFGADLTYTNLSGTTLRDAAFRFTVIANVDLSEAIGLDAVRHDGPSSIGLDTFFKSKGKIPEVFLRGAGVPDTFIKYAASLAGTSFEFNSCFISYSTKDDTFVQRLYADLDGKGVRCWFALHDLKIGDKFRVEIDQAIRDYDKFLIVLSKHSVESDWVEKEVEAAFEEERRRKRVVLFPIRLDDAVMKVEGGWAADIRRTRHIGDFRKWRDSDASANAFERLLRDLKSQTPKPDSSKADGH